MFLYDFLGLILLLQVDFIHLFAFRIGRVLIYGLITFYKVVLCFLPKWISGGYPLMVHILQFHKKYLDWNFNVMLD